MKESNHRFLLIFFLFLILFNCTKQKPDNAFEVLIFEIDSLKIAEPYISAELGIMFNPPRDWQPVSRNIVDELGNSAIEVTEDSLNISVEQIFLNLSNSSFIFLSSFPEIDRFELAYNNLRDLMTGKISSQELKIGSFEHNNLKFYQFINTSANKVALKLIAESKSGSVFMFDYIMPYSVYRDNLKAIESSIGTIKNAN